MDTSQEKKYEAELDTTFFERTIQHYDYNAEGNSREIDMNKLLLEPPKDNKEQIERISLVVKAVKCSNKFTADQIAERLPKEHIMTRAALNAYIYGKVKTPPTRDFMIALFKALDVPEESITSGLDICGYKGTSKEKNVAKSLILEVAKENKKNLSNSSIEKISKRLYSIAKLFVDEELNEGRGKDTKYE
jgi:transcriptional regulator with XRE-family HTH domain